MPTENPRLNITLTPDTALVLTTLAKKEHKSVSSLAKELILESLERHEDMILSAMAEKRDVKSSKLIKHEDAWK